MKGCVSRFTREGGGVRRRKEKHGHSRDITGHAYACFK